MTKISKTYDPGNDLTIFEVMGEITFNDVSDQTHTFFSGKQSKLVLWDFTSGTVANISNQEVQTIAKIGMATSARIKGGKAAILTPKDVDYGISRVFQVFSEVEKFPFEI